MKRAWPWLLGVSVVVAGAAVARDRDQCAAEGRFACNLKALAPAERARHELLRKELVLAQAQDVKRLPDGVRVRYDKSASREGLEEWAEGERKCCPFFHIAVEDAPDAVYLQVTGPPGAQALLDEALVARTL